MQNITNSNDLLSVAYHFLDELNIKYSKEYVTEFLREHVDYPSMGALVGLLNEFNIDNAPVRLSFEKFAEMPLPAVTYLQGEDIAGGGFVLVRQVSTSEVTFINSENIVVSEPIGKFLAKWTGGVLVAQPNEYSRSVANDEAIKLHTQKRGSWFMIGMISIILLVTLPVIVYQNGIFTALTAILILKIMGIILTVSLLAEELGVRSNVLNSVCTVGGLKKENGCRRVSNSNAAIFFGIRMSEFGLFYFSGGLLLTLISMTSHQNLLSFIFLAAILTTPYTLFSIFYQMKVVKDICSLCIAVILVLWCECLVLTLTDVPLLPATFENIGVVIIFGIIPALVWLLLREHIFRGASTLEIRKQLRIFQSSPNALMGSLVKSSKKINFDVNDKVVLNEQGEVVVHVVLSYFCSSCGVMLHDILTIALQNDAIKFEIIFVTGEPSYDNIARNMLINKYNGGNEAAVQFLRQWYHGRVDDTIDHSSVPRETMADIQQTIDSWRDYVINNNVNTTPRVFIDSHLKPNGISLMDYKVLFHEMARNVGTMVEQ